jgi:O-antigen/teichoic acid export membrane protein
VPFVLLPFLARWLEPTELGRVGVAFSLVGLFNAIIGLNLHGLVTRNYFDYESNQLSWFIGRVLVVLLVTVVFAAGSLLLLGETASEVLDLPASWLWVVLGISVAQFIVNVQLALYQAEDRATAFGMVQVSVAILGGSLSLLLVVLLFADFRGRLLGHLAAVALVALIGIGVLLRRGLIRFAPIAHEEWFVMIRYGVPLIPHVIASWMLLAADRSLVSGLCGNEAAGIYFAAVQISQIVLLIQDSTNKAWVPWVYARLRSARNEDLAHIAKLSWRVALVYLGAALVIALLAPPLVYLLAGPKYQAASYLVAALGLGYALEGIYKLFVNNIFYQNRTALVCVVTLVSAAISLAVNLTLIPVWGIGGAALGLVAGAASSLVVSYVISRRLVAIPYFVRT